MDRFLKAVIADRQETQPTIRSRERFIVICSRQNLDFCLFTASQTASSTGRFSRFNNDLRLTNLRRTFRSGHFDAGSEEHKDADQ